MAPPAYTQFNVHLGPTGNHSSHINKWMKNRKQLQSEQEAVNLCFCCCCCCRATATPSVCRKLFIDGMSHSSLHPDATSSNVMQNYLSVPPTRSVLQPQLRLRHPDPAAGVPIRPRASRPSGGRRDDAAGQNPPPVLPIHLIGCFT